MSEAETEWIRQIKERLNQIEVTFHSIQEQNTRLERAVGGAADRGDALAQAVKSGSEESSVENLIAHFEAAGKLEHADEQQED